MRSMFQKLITSMIVLTLSIPFVSLAEQNSVEAEAETAALRDAYAASLETKIKAEQDASQDTNKFLWLGAGAGAYIAVPVGIIGGLLVGELISPSETSGLFYASMSPGAILGCLVGGQLPSLQPIGFILMTHLRPLNDFSVNPLNMLPFTPMPICQKLDQFGENGQQQGL